MSGNLAAYGNISYGWENYWDWINEEFGGIGGRELKMIIKDDGYVAAQTIEFVDELIESANVFALHGLGSPNGLAVYDKINDECVPHLFYASGHPAWGDPVNHPWTTSHQMSYLTEAVLWGTWIKGNLADQLPVKVGGLVMDNDFGLAYEKGFEYSDKRGHYPRSVRPGCVHLNDSRQPVSLGSSRGGGLWSSRPDICRVHTICL